MKFSVPALLAAWLTLAIALPLHAAGPLVISEFMADNGSTLADEEGDFPDWIEIHNPSGATVNLAGWRLTDDPARPAKWTFPALPLPPGGYVVVFASGKDRTNNPARLHTNFQLDAAGEYLALLQPDGTIAQQFAPAYPAQLEDVSFGTQLVTTTTRFLTNGATARWTVPLSAGDYPADWAATNFTDTAWGSGRTPLGFDLGPSNIVVGGTATNVALGKTATQSSTLSGFTADLAVNGNLGDFTHTAAGQGLPATWSVNLGTNYAIERIVLQNRSSCCGSRMRDITVRILSETGATNYTSPLLNPENSLGSGLNGPASITVNLVQLTGAAVLGAQVRVTRTPDPDLSGTGGQGNADEADVLSLGEVEVYGLPAAGSFNTILRTDLAAAARNVNASTLVRLPFLVVGEELPALDQLSLRMRFDDGFIAFLNGVQVAAANAPASPAWNSAATAENPDAAAVTGQSFDLSTHAGLLQDGLNVLALQALNVTAADDDFLVGPELTGVSSAITGERYFTQPTPGAGNTGGSLGFVADTKFSADRGFYTVPFTVAITTATAGASIYYTTNGSAPSETSGFRYTAPVPISRTTVLRAIATKPGFTPSDVDTHTYVFLPEIVAQSAASVAAAGYPATWAGVGADYAMDTRITSSNVTQMIPSLRSLPSLFVSTSISNLFDSANGIYARPTSAGIAWERPASIELVDTNGATEFQENAGLRIQGGYFRDANVTQKHSFRVLFKSLYGAGRLRHNLFPGTDATEEFDGFVLRAGANDGYSWGDARDTEQFTRCQFGNQLHIDMGHSSPHGRFVHLYLNGIYWGQYHLVERPNEDFSAAYHGGDPTQWDAINAGDVKNGDLTAWNTLVSQSQSGATDATAYQRAQGRNANGSRNPALPIYLDAPNYIDYMIANIWGGNWDWPNKNFWMGRDRTTNSTGFKFYMWDFENTMGNNRARSPINMVSPRTDIANTWVGQPHFYLKNNHDYRMDFADRVQRFFFNDGLFTVSTLTNRYRRLADSVESSIYAETARWGDDNINPPQDIEDWRRERDWLLTQYLVQRTDVVMGQFRAAGLYPAVGAPFFSSYGGFVAPDAQLTITQTNAGGTIYVTTDGSDPRLVGGALNPSALPYTAPVAIGGNAIVQARVRSGTNWSALVRGEFATAAYFRPLVLTEIMYNPPGTTNVVGDEFEFLELKNTGATELNLSGLSFTSGVTFTFTNGARLAPGAFVLLARNAAQFQAKYPATPLYGTYSGALANAGETLRLAHPVGGTILSVTYSDDLPWPVAADGLGFSIVPATPGDTNTVNSDIAAHWRASANAGGSPGADDPTPGIPVVLVNEALTHSGASVDFIELLNPSASPVNVGGWFLSDDKGVPTKFRIPDGTTIPAQGYVVFTESDFNPTPGLGNSFTLDAAGEQVYLFSGTGAGQLTGYSHGFAFGAAPDGYSFGRHILSTGAEEFPLQVSTTPLAANAGPRVGPVVLSEIHYNPRPGDDAFVEVRNIGPDPVRLYLPEAPTNTWRIGGLSFSFPENITLAGGAHAIVCSSEPASFRARYGVPAGVPVFGPYGGSLQDSGERLELQAPDRRNTNGIVFVTIDEVRYNDRAPWPSAADGIGPALQRLPLSGYGNDPIHWRAASPTPGRDFSGGTPPTVTQNPANVTVVATREATFAVGASGPGPISYQWRFNGAAIAGATNSLLTLTNLQAAQAGSYSAVVYNDAGAVESSPATLIVLTPARILQQPADVLVRIRPDPNSAPTTNVTFVIAASSTSPIAYQWLFNGTPIPGAFNPSLTITNVTLANEGTYTAEITDAAGTIYSRAANLFPLITPAIVQPPVPMFVGPNTPFTLSVAVSGNPKPFTMEWRRGSVPIGTNIVWGTQDFFTFVSTPTPSTNTYRVIVKNLANSTPGVASANISVIVSPDTDNDGIPDAWETQFGLNPNNGADGALDADGDGLTNRQEHDAGTDPANGQSYLQVQIAPAAEGTAQISFGAISNRTYSILRAATPAGPWQKAADVVARPVNRVENLADPAGGTNRFYRVVTPWQP